MTSVKTKPSLRYRMGIFLVIFGVFMPVLAVVVPFLGLSEATTALLIGVLAVGGPEVCMLIGAALAGKEGAQLIIGKIKAVFKGKPKPVGRRRYNIGIFMLIFGLSIPVIVTYWPYFSDVKTLHGMQHYLRVTGDVIVIVSFFVLGGQFWAKLQKLFIWEPGYNE